ncbi:Type-1 restriction enzyme R protein [Variovorax sp. PBL-H6]|uniref:type I restriction endonuclease subunit R n=1 Tax=Variovorax sp. PBL-H6 TaxID=434009 RepID=UPI001315DF2B|nr:HsdR family type I site-specific deoxyribonuclease [Variovorax sp. PBL-H6]VTU39721.1 Type-1 restriction enzyme R protein [Variovorax sp. PBL-H6]
MSVAPSAHEPCSAQMCALRMLCRMGWNYLSATDCLALRRSTREVLLKPRLIELLQTRRFDYKGEAYPLSPSAIDQILRELSNLGIGEGLLAANERFYAKLAYGITVTEFMPDGRRHQPTIHVIDWTNPSANRFDVTEELRVLSSHGAHSRAPDIVAYVNGIPLVVIEAKQPQWQHGGSLADAMVLEGISQQLRNQRHDEIPELFAYAQLLLSISQTDGRYGTTGTPEKLWARWNQDEEFDDAMLTALKNAPLPASVDATLLKSKAALMRGRFQSLGSPTLLPNQQDRLLVGLLKPQRLLDLLRGFVLFDSKIGKIVARHHQFFGVRALLERLAGQRADGGRNGGVIWHTTGSGKSFTMVFLAKALLLNEGLKECRLVVITDRRDLEQQLARNFMTGGAFGSSIVTHKEGEHSRALTGRDLALRIGQGTKRITFALVQKFNTASRLAACRNDSPDVVVLVDEGHRSHGGETHERMKRSLPRAAYVAFTGTPLLKEEKTAQKFGPIIHAYTMQRATEDHAIAPLLYEERVPGLSIDADAVDRWFDKITNGLAEAQRADLKKKYARSGVVHGAAKRIDLIAWDIATHFHENFKRVGSGLKGQVATASKLDAVRYKKALDATGLVTSAVVISPPDMREGNTRIDEDGMAEVQKWWRQNVDPGIDAVHHERSVLQAFGTRGDPDLLIVVDRLLTGFDEPRNAVLYIDKPLKGHNLIQAVARVNRLHGAKRHGLLVDYRGILKELDTAIRAYQDLEARTQGGFEIGDLEGLYAQVSTEYKQLPMRHETVWSFFESVADRKDPEQLRQALSPRLVSDGMGGEYDERQKLRDDFHAALTAFGAGLQAALASRGFFEDRSVSQALIAQYKADLKTLIQVRQAARRDAGETVDFSEYDEQIRRLVDQQVIGTKVQESDKAYLADKLGLRDVAGIWSRDKARNEADLIKTRLRKTIEQDLADDPYARQVFSELLQSAIEQAEAMFDHPLRQYSMLKDFERDLDRRATPGVPEALASNPMARACYGAILIALGEEASRLDEAQQSQLVNQALAISHVIQAALAEHSLNPQNIEAAIRKGLLQLLYAPLGLDRANDVIGHVLQITRVVLARRT